MCCRASLPVLLLLSLLLCVAESRAAEAAEPRSFHVDPSLHQQQQQQLREPTAEDEFHPDSKGVRRFACPAGFFRLRRNCYYLSGGTAPWREAYFQCTARNATLAILNRAGKDKMLRKYLMGDQFKSLERWIGGIYNWLQRDWEWGQSSDKVQYQNFAESERLGSRSFAYQCIVLDPLQQYKWSARNCVEPKYYICEAPAGQIPKSRRRKNIADPLAPQNQRLRPTKRDEYKHHRADGSSSSAVQQQRRRSGSSKLKSMRKKAWRRRGHDDDDDDNQIWANGIKFGSRPPKGSRKLKRPESTGRHSGHKHALKTDEEEHKVSQLSAQSGAYDAFPADGHALTDERLQSLDDTRHLYPPLIGKDYVREEVLLKV